MNTVPHPGVEPANMPPLLQVVLVERIDPSPTNPRKHFDEVKLGELADSIARIGIIQAPIVRTHPEHRARLELICGERRWRAAQRAGLASIGVVVRNDLTDVEILELQIVENGERNDLTPLEESDAIAGLAKLGRSREQIAAKLGRSVTWVERRLSLQRLHSVLRELLAQERLALGGAFALAQLNHGDQEKVAKRFVAMFGDNDRVVDAWQVSRAVDDVTMRLKDVPWDVADVQLVVVAGACTGCPKRLSAQPDLFEDAVGDQDRCLDRSCYDAKKAAHAERRAKEVRAAGGAVLAKKEAKELFDKPEWNGDKPRVKSDSGYLDLDAQAPRDPKYGRKLRELVGAQPVPLVIAQDAEGNVRELVRAADVKAILKEKLKIKDQPADPNAAWKAREAKRKEEERKEQRVRREAVGEVVEQVEKGMADYDATKVALLYWLETPGNEQFAEEIVERRGIETKDAVASLRKLVAKMDEPHVIDALVVEILLTPYELEPVEQRERKAFKELGVDVGAIEKRFAAEDKAAEEAKAAAKKPAKGSTKSVKKGGAK